MEEMSERKAPASTSSAKRTKCEIVEDRKVEPCWALDQAIEWDVRGKGLRYVQLTKLHTGNFGDGHGFVTMHSGEFKKKGVVLNHCPFCGTNISAHMKTVGVPA